MNENPGGVEAFLKNYKNYMDTEKIQFDFLCNTKNPVAFEEVLTQTGSLFFHITPRSQNPKLFYQELKAFFEEHSQNYDTLWVNLNSLANVDYLKYARKYGIKRRIIHSHNSQNMDSFLRGLLHRLNKLTISNLATDYWACSESAASWFYPKNLLSQAKIINNAIKVEDLAFDAAKRASLRQQLGWQENFIIGNIGRLHFQKNQEFLLDLMAEWSKTRDDLRLVLIGQGEDEEKLKNKVRELGLADKVHFAGVQYDIAGWLSSFDLFLFPSQFEGLSIAALEAQANGLPLLSADHILPDYIRLNDNILVASLADSTEVWTEKFEQVYTGKISREEADMTKKFTAIGFNIDIEATKLQDDLLQG